MLSVPFPPSQNFNPTGREGKEKKTLVPSALRRHHRASAFRISQSGGRGASPAGDPSENRRFPLLPSF